MIYHINDKVTYPAASFCRNLKIKTLAENGCDLPSLQVLMRIYQSRKIIDNIDPTVSIFPENSLEKWLISSNGVWNCIHTSQQYDNENQWCINVGGYVLYTDIGYNKSMPYGVLPIIEIPYE